MALSIVQVAKEGTAHVSYAPPPNTSTADFTFGILNSLSTILFAYGGHNIALEIQATIPNPPPSTIPVMMKGVNITFAVTFFLYFGVVITGYAAFGNTAAAYILDSITIAPVWIATFTRMLVVIHVGSAYQVYSYPLYDMWETAIAKKRQAKVNLPTRIALRCAYVAATGIVALLIPFFGDLMGLIGAIAVTPTTFVLPCILWLVWRQPALGSRNWLLNWALILVCSAIGLMGCIGSLYSIVEHASTFKFFTS